MRFLLVILISCSIQSLCLSKIRLNSFKQKDPIDISNIIETPDLQLHIDAIEFKKPDGTLFEFDPNITATDNLKQLNKFIRSRTLQMNPHDAIQIDELPLDISNFKDRPSMPFFIPDSNHTMPVHIPDNNLEYYLKVHGKKED